MSLWISFLNLRCRRSLGDSHQLMQIFLNLILNAEQAMREARDRGTLRIRLEKVQ